MLCLWKTSREQQMLFAAVTHLVEGLSLETLLTLKVTPLIFFHWFNVSIFQMAGF
jgi:hypothetical protein